MIAKSLFPKVALAVLVIALLAERSFAAEPLRQIAVTPGPEDVLPTGNEWISLPTIRASDAALTTFNVLSMRDRGLLQVRGDAAPVLQPYVAIGGKVLPLANPKWQLIEYWIPVAQFTSAGMDVYITYCAPPGSRAAFARLIVTNRRTQPVSVDLGMKASWGALDRVTYTPIQLHGRRSIGDAPWVSPGVVFSFVTHDTIFAWSLLYPGSRATRTDVPLSTSPTVDATRTVALAPGQSAESLFVLGAGIEEFSAAHNANALRESLDRRGADQLIADTAEWCRQRTRTTGQPALDTLMNRNFLFTALYAWGKTIDTEQFVGVTSRSPRYYVSAAYWDRDAMLWSLPALLDVDPARAREALEYALGPQLRNTGVHSRFIDGVVLEDGFELDEAAAPVLALDAYMNRTKDHLFLSDHRRALLELRAKLLERFDPATGLYSTLQDSQDEYEKQPFFTYGNVITWRALLQMAALFEQLNEPEAARDLHQRADALRQAILRHCVAKGAPGATGPIFVATTDGTNVSFADVPPGSLMLLPTLGFVREDDPVFARTYLWLHSSNYHYSYSAEPYGLPGSYRLPFTTSWTVADHLRLAAGRERALNILRSSTWDGGIISEGIDPTTGGMDRTGPAFATAAGYVSHAICDLFCTDHRWGDFGTGTAHFARKRDTAPLTFTASQPGPR